VAAGARLVSTASALPYKVAQGGIFYVEVTQAAGAAAAPSGLRGRQAGGESRGHRGEPRHEDRFLVGGGGASPRDCTRSTAPPTVVDEEFRWLMQR